MIATLGLMLCVALPVEKVAAQTTTKKETTATAEKKSGELKVYGSCSMCKTRIEKAAREVKGVKSVKWNQETQTLTFEYKPSLASIDDVAKKVAEVGHDNEKFKASDEVYNSLPTCCKYRK